MLNKYFVFFIPKNTGNVLIPTLLSPFISSTSLIISLINVSRNVSNDG